tara:strand:+ start:1080 stop:1286 length:207 start_codon:yes stop_codon:yes gene_type:complete
MKVKVLIERLKKENPEEEVVFILDENRSEYHLLEWKPFLHAGPKEFIGKHGNKYFTSVVMIKAKRQKK